MKITIVIPDELALRLKQYIRAKYGEKARAVSLVTQEALREYLRKHRREIQSQL